MYKLQSTLLESFKKSSFGRDLEQMINYNRGQTQSRIYENNQARQLLNKFSRQIIYGRFNKAKSKLETARIYLF